MTVRPDDANGSSASLNETAGSTRAQSPAPSRQRLSRRLMLRGAGAALPVMLTLHSGAALARSSNLISRSGAVDEQGKALCLDETAGQNLGDGRFDLGDESTTGSGTVWDMPNRDYYTQVTGENALTGDPISAAEACERSGDLYFQAGDNVVKAQKVNQGILVSATAVASFTGRGILNITNL